MSEATDKANLIELTTGIVAAFVENNAVPAGDLPDLIKSVFSTLTNIDSPAAPATAEKPKPAVPLRQAVQNDFVVCLEDGLKFKSLKRHLRTKYNMSPDEYRARWGLPKDSPMVAPSYSAARSRLAKDLGLGQGDKRKAPIKAKGRAKK